MNELRTIISELVDAYYNTHTDYMDNWYQKQKIQVTNFTNQKEIILPPIVYNEIITGFLNVMKLDESERKNTIHNLYDQGIFKMTEDKYLMFIRN